MQFVSQTKYSHNWWPSIIPYKREDKNIEIAICNALHKDREEYLKEGLYNVVPGGKGWLLEASMSKLKRDTLTQDPTRAKKSKHVQSKYIGISKYGVLNFETTSETYSGVKWYQEVHFPSLSGFMNIIEQGDEIEAVDIQKAMKSDNIKISCDDPSFLYWAWKYKACRDVYGLEKETRAPKRNNTQLQGALCKHLYSVIELLGQKRIIDLITRDMNEFCKRKLNKSNVGYQDSPEMLNKDLKANQYDYNIEDVYKALETIYGTELMEDNTEECKQKILMDCLKWSSSNDLDLKDKKLMQIIEHNIVCTDTFKWDYENWKSCT